MIGHLFDFILYRQHASQELLHSANHMLIYNMNIYFALATVLSHLNTFVTT